MTEFYHEELLRPTVQMWRSTADGSARRILPDGCLDLLFDGASLFVAGPDTSARFVRHDAGTRFHALRFSAGSGAAFLGVPADELLDTTTTFDALCSGPEFRRAIAHLEDDPASAMKSLLSSRLPVSPAEKPTFGPRVLAMADAAVPVPVMASSLGIGERRLHRQTVAAFGYGPRTLTRIRRMNRAVARIRVGHGLSDVAYGEGYSDQAHLSREIRDLAGTTPTALRAAPF